MSIYFLSECVCPNYIHDISQYKFLGQAKVVHIPYYYWILKNCGIKNIKMITSIEDIDNSNQSIVFFFRDIRRNTLNTDSLYAFDGLQDLKCIKIQMVSDTDLVDWADFFFINDPTQTDDKKIFIHHPLPAILHKKKPNIIPKTFCSCSQKFNLHYHFYKKTNLIKFQNANINFMLEHELNSVHDNFDVFFFLRNCYIKLLKNSDGSIKHPISGYKHASRLFQSWYMNTPCILNNEPQIEYFVKDELDCMYANTIDEFYNKCMLLIENNDLYLSIIEHYKKKEILNSNENICKFFIEFFKKFNFTLT